MDLRLPAGIEAAAAAATIFVAVVGCRSAPAPGPRESDDDRARRAARAFVQCYEREGAECLTDRAPVRGWVALETLALVRDGIPTDLVDRLPEALARLREAGQIRRDLVRALADHESWARTAGCVPAGLDSAAGRPVGIARAAATRLERLGLADSDAAMRLAALADEAAAVDDARTFELQCGKGGRTMFLTLARVDDGFAVVGFSPHPPAWRERRRDGLTRAARVRLLPRSAEWLHPWLPFTEEQF